tara:strand:- start:380 stop:910 length:531 start_codon:yes stop_codon:yes gene_type:complete
MGKTTNPSSFGIATGSHGWGISYQRILKSNVNSEINFEFRFYDVKGTDEFPISTNYGTETINEKSLVISPVFAGFRYYPFEGKIENNFSPFVTLKAGPLFIFDGNEEITSFIERWKKAEIHVAFGGHAGIGVKFLRSNVSSISVSAGLDIFPMNGTIDDQSQYNGFLLQFEFSWWK